MFTVHRALLIVGIAATLVAANHEDGHAAPGCKKFSEIYSGGKALCENMWDGAFTYTPDDPTTGANEENRAYTMWWTAPPLLSSARYKAPHPTWAHTHSVHRF